MSTTPIRSWNASSATVAKPTGRPSATATKACRSSLVQVPRTASAWTVRQSGSWSRSKIASPSTSRSDANTGSHARNASSTTASRSNSSSGRISAAKLTAPLEQLAQGADEPERRDDGLESDVARGPGGRVELPEVRRQRAEVVAAVEERDERRERTEKDPGTPIDLRLDAAE